MEKRSPIIRLVLALWVLSSQIAGAALVLSSVVVLLAFRSVGVSGPNAASFNFLLALGFIMSAVFIGLGITAWVMFAKRKDGSAGLLGLATLVPGGILLLAMQTV
ncbi:MAG: hypothetical protein DPW18_20270 [Chloroflexi bacterium]|nr:hypothetical protein [Chloroflexota bacterium]MDL1945108.1 hypothetical protein [Chloroflexi bacterium CFX2]